MRRRPAERLRRGLPKDEAELRPEGLEVRKVVKLREEGGDSGEMFARGRHAKDNERLHKHTVLARRGGEGSNEGARRQLIAKAYGGLLRRSGRRQQTDMEGGWKEVVEVTEWWQVEFRKSCFGPEYSSDNSGDGPVLWNASQILRILCSHDWKIAIEIAT